MATCAIPIHKLGTVDCDIVEANPVVWRNRLLRFEYIRWKSPEKHYHGNWSGQSYFRFVDVAGGEIMPPFGIGLHMGNAFVWEDRMIVTAVEDWGKPRFYQIESTDLIHWSEPRLILEGPGWEGYNTTLCRAGDRFVMAFELGAPRDLVGVPFTMFFAESADLVHFRVIPGAVFGREFYTGGPMLRWFNGFYYLFYLDGSYDQGYRTCVVRSCDLRSWQWSPVNPVLDYGEEDRRLHGVFTPQQEHKIKNAVNINASDLDMCYFEGKLQLVYSWGDQRGTEFLAMAEADADEAKFCESYFA